MLRRAKAGPTRTCAKQSVSRSFKTGYALGRLKGNSDDTEARVMRRGLDLVALLVGVAVMWPPALSAQSPDAAIPEIRVGDGWVYDRKDDISGSPIGTFTSLVTEVSPQEIVTQVNYRGKNGHGLVVFDHDWNRTLDNNIKYKPNDGHGVRMPL